MNIKGNLWHDTHVRMWVLLTLWASAVLMLMCISSPIHHIYNRIDSAWFFMGGKAMMNGMAPYVDFTDSKGPLLWLIYGIGYRLSPQSYFGVYVMACLAYGVTLYFNWRTVMLLLGDTRRALLATVAMTWIYFLYWFCNDIRAEDFCNVFVAVSLLVVMRLLTTGRGGRTAARRDGLVLGASFMALVLIKWNVAAMQATLVAAALWYYWREKRQGLQTLGAAVAGAAAVALPFVVYLAVMGSLGGFVEEYFVNTLGTVEGDDGLIGSLQDEMARSWRTPARQTLLLVIVAGGWLVSRRLKCYRWVPLLTGLTFYVLSTVHYLGHYYSVCSIFCIFSVAHVVSYASKPLHLRHLAAAAAAVLCWGVFENVREGSPLKKVTLWCSGEDSVNYVHIQRISHGLDGVYKPRIINLYGSEYGFGVEQESLPAGKHWTYQLGMTPAMVEEHKALLRSGRADFVVVGNEERCDGAGFTKEVIESYGYRQVLRQPYVYYHDAQRIAAIYRRRKD
jgi:hypothetical protein